MIDFTGYLILIILLFGVNIGLILNDFNTKNKAILISIVYSVLMGICSFIVTQFSANFSFLTDIMAYIILIVGIILFLVTIFYLYNWKTNEEHLTVKSPIFISIVVCSFVCILSFISLWNLNPFTNIKGIIVTISLFLIILLIYKFSKIFKNAKSPYPLIVGEYMILESILLFILGLTFNSVRDLDYSMFSSFLILTPTYQLLYVLIFLVAVVVLGVFLGDRQLKK